MIDTKDALGLILREEFAWGTEKVPLARATGRVLRQRVVADRDQPPFDRVAMDGIAIDFTAYASGQRRFPVSHLAPAGSAPRRVKDTQHCVEVMTGAPLPPGTTTVIRYEDLVEDGDAFMVPEGVVDARSIHRRGNDGRVGDVLLNGGRKIGPAETAVLATYGVAEVEVARNPRVAIVSTGDEIVPVGEKPEDHQIRSSNVYQLSSLFRAAGIEATLAHLGDEAALGKERLGELLAKHDIVLLSGGVSKGKLDHVPDWLAAAGVNRLFHRVAQRPGKPLWVGRNANTMVFALPGNPASSLVCTLAYVGPFLRANLGLPEQPIQVELSEEINFPPDLTLFQTVTVTNEGGKLSAMPTANGGSGDLVGLLRATGFVVLERGLDKFPVGGIFPYLPLYLY